jgi:hypothetical protein
MNRPLLLKNFDEAVDEACKIELALKKVRKKMNALLEDYAVGRGTSMGKLRLVDLYTGQGKLRPEFERHILEIYPLSNKSRPSYVSCAKRMIKAIAKAKGVKSTEVVSLPIGTEIPDEVKRMLAVLPRDGTREELRDPERRTELPLTRNAVFLLLAVLSVWAEYELTELEMVLRDRVRELRRAIRQITGREYADSTNQLINHVRTSLGIPAPEPVSHLVPLEEMLEPLRTEIMNYCALASTLGDEKPSKEREKERRLIRKAAKHGRTLRQHRRGTVRQTAVYLGRMYGHILPAIRADGLQSFGLKDLMAITSEAGVDEDGEEEVKLYNKYLEIYRNIEMEKSNEYKRAGYDSTNFKNCYVNIRKVAAYNGYFAPVKKFSEAYRSITLDTERTELRKEVKKRIFSLTFVDAQLKVLRVKYERILKSKSFMRGPDRQEGEANLDLTLCFFYVAFVMMRYLSYRQQCIRKCAVGTNITFNPDGSVTLFWTRHQVKNKKPIRVTLTPERYDGAWEPVIHALTSYHDTVYPYVLKLANKQGTLDSLERQFNLRLSWDNSVVRWDPDTATGFYEWFHRWARNFLAFPEEAIEADIRFNPHFLRGLCMDWMISIGMSLKDISSITGDTEIVISLKYLDQSAANDATRVLAQTDRRLKQEREDGFDAKAYVEAVEKAHEDEIRRRDEREEEERRRHEREKQAMAEQIADLRAALAGAEVVRAG